MANGIVQPDFIEAGAGSCVILVHSSVAGAGQWRRLMTELHDHCHVIAVNLYGYGKTESWSAPRAQSLDDQARLLRPLIERADGSVSLVGHSFGGSVAMKAAALYSSQVERLILIEPNPFYLLKQDGRAEAFAEAVKLRNIIAENGKAGTWEVAAEAFANYWSGQGTWDSMPDERKQKFVHALKPNFHEWDAVMDEKTGISEWSRTLPEETTVVSAEDTVRSIAEIVDLFRKNVPHWRYEKIDAGGHMAVLNHADVVNPKILKALATG